MIEMIGVVKVYRPHRYLPGPAVRALHDIELRVEAGTALGVIGLNGAGKSTLIRVLLGFAQASEGEVSIGGLDPRAYVERNGVAYVPERVAIPRGWTVRGALRAYAMFAGLGADAWQRVDAAMDRLGLASLANRKIATLSKGNVQRVGIAQALLGDRKLMVLDEPTEGLDPLWTTELRSIIAAWRAGDPDRVVILASHNLAEVERLTDRCVLLHNGRIRSEIPIGAGRRLEESFLSAVADLEEARP